MKFSLLLSLLFLLASCNDADIASKNISRAADNFEILRRIVFYNGINGEYILSIEGLCSFERNTSGISEIKQVSVTCKKGGDKFVKHSLGLSDNVTYFSEQMKAEFVSVYHYRVIFKPQAILPNIDFTSGSTKGRDK